MSDLNIDDIGASETLVSDFRAVFESPSNHQGSKYNVPRVRPWLLKVVIGHGGGANKDTPLLELCHLILAVNSMGSNSTKINSRMDFFFGLSNTTTGNYKNYFFKALENENKKGILEVKDTVLDIKLIESIFSISYSRMSRLSALYEFIISMNSFGDFDKLNNVFDVLQVNSNEKKEGNIQLIKDVTNQLSSILRKYRQEHLPRTQNDFRFTKLFNFLKNKNPDGNSSFDDEDILQFWIDHSFIDDFRVYKRVFDDFRILTETVAEISLQKSVTGTEGMGPSLDKDNEAEYATPEPKDDASKLTDFKEWETPLDILDQEFICEMNILKNKTERAPIENLMWYGPFSLKCPLAFLRMQVFGFVQSGISNDLRLGKKRADIERRMDCKGARSYSDYINQLVGIIDHIRTVQLAIFFILNNKEGTENLENKVVNLFSQVSSFELEKNDNSSTIDQIPKLEIEAKMDEARLAFKSINRAGFFEDTERDVNKIEALEQASIALIEIEKIIEKFVHISFIKREKEYGNEFSSDIMIFSKQFKRIYEVANG